MTSTQVCAQRVSERERESEIAYASNDNVIQFSCIQVEHRRLLESRMQHNKVNDDEKTEIATNADADSNANGRVYFRILTTNEKKKCVCHNKTHVRSCYDDDFARVCLFVGR